MNNTQKFIASEFDLIKSKCITGDEFKPQITVNFGLCKSKHISVRWDTLEQIKQLLIDNEKGE